MIRFSAFFLLLGVYASSSPVGAQQEALASFRILSVEEQQGALDFIRDKIINSGYGSADITDRYSGTVLESMYDITSLNTSHYTFAFRLNRLLSELFNDAHTRVEVNVAKEEGLAYHSLDVCLAWLSGREEPTLISTCQTNYAEIGDTVVTVGSLSPKEIFEELNMTIPHENLYFLERLPQSWLVREDFLAYLGVIQTENNTVDLVLERDGVVLPSLSIPLGPSPTSEAPSTSTDSFVSYKVYNEFATAVFTLNECIYDQEYVTVLEDFWSTVKANNGQIIDTVVLDLRLNRGGDFTVAPAFLKYITDAPYQLFDVRQRQSEDYCEKFSDLCAPETLGFLQQLGVNTTNDEYFLPGSALSIFFGQLVGPPPTADKMFNGQLVVLISGTTFSSAHLFAGVVQLNNLGKLVGTPTGNAPTFGGNLIDFAVPNTDLTFYLRTSLTVLPFTDSTDGSQGPKNAVYPDELVLSSLQDIVGGRDKQLDSLLMLADNETEAPSPSPTSNEGSSASKRIGFAYGLYTVHLCVLLVAGFLLT